MNEREVTISLDEYRDLIKRIARYELLEEQEKAKEEELKRWTEAHKGE